MIIILFPACEAVPSDEQQRREAFPLQDHRLSSHKLPGIKSSGSFLSIFSPPCWRPSWSFILPFDALLPADRQAHCDRVRWPWVPVWRLLSVLPHSSHWCKSACSFPLVGQEGGIQLCCCADFPFDRREYLNSPSCRGKLTFMKSFYLEHLECLFFFANLIKVLLNSLLNWNII